jgi:hypothetical protein
LFLLGLSSFLLLFFLLFLLLFFLLSNFKVGNDFKSA